MRAKHISRHCAHRARACAGVLVFMVGLCGALFGAGFVQAQLSLGGPALGGPSLGGPSLGGPEEKTPSGDELVELGLHTEEYWYYSGSSSWLALTMTIEPQWHVYWRNNGETGAPPTFDWDVPKGLSIGEPVWPVPEWYEHDYGSPEPSGIIDFTYHDEVTLLFPVDIGEDLERKDYDIRLNASWLVCKDVCLPGQGVVEVGLRVLSKYARVDPPRNEAWRKAREEAQLLFEATRAKLPASRGAATHAGVRTAVDGSTLTITVPGASQLTFFHDNTGDPGLYVEDVAANNTAKGDTLRIQYSGDIEQTLQLTGVLSVTQPRSDGESHTTSYEIIHSHNQTHTSKEKTP